MLDEINGFLRIIESFVKIEVGCRNLAVMSNVENHQVGRCAVDVSSQGGGSGLSSCEDEAQEPLTKGEAASWRKTHVALSIWRVIFWQVVCIFVVGSLAWLATGSAAVVWSSVYGGCAVVLPGAFAAWGVSRSRVGVLLSLFAKGSLAVVMFWEGIKVLLTIAMLALAPRVVGQLNWLALVASFVLVLKVYWLVLFLSASTLNRNDS